MRAGLRILPTLVAKPACHDEAVTTPSSLLAGSSYPTSAEVVHLSQDPYTTDPGDTPYFQSAKAFTLQLLALLTSAYA